MISLSLAKIIGTPQNFKIWSSLSLVPHQNSHFEMFSDKHFWITPRRFSYPQQIPFSFSCVFPECHLSNITFPKIPWCWLSHVFHGFSMVFPYFVMVYHQFSSISPRLFQQNPVRNSHQVLDTWHESVRRGKAAAKGRRGSGLVGVSCEFPGSVRRDCEPIKTYDFMFHISWWFITLIYKTYLKKR